MEQPFQPLPGPSLRLRWPYFAPTYVTTHPLELDPKWLYERGVRGIIFDFDNTLISSHGHEIGDGRAALLERCIRTFGAEHIVIVSNKLRVFGLANKLDEEAARFGIKAISTGVVVKPFRRALRLAMEHIKLPVGEVLMVGDLLLTDILGGKRMGMQTLLVAPVHAPERFGIKTLRTIERLLLGYHAPKEGTSPTR